MLQSLMRKGVVDDCVGQQEALACRCVKGKPSFLVANLEGWPDDSDPEASMLDASRKPW
jgi:hypothetical protein